jgi:hypothetical protein
MKTAAKMGNATLRATTSCAIAAAAILAAGCDNNHLLGAVDGGPQPPERDSGTLPGVDAGPDLPRTSGSQSWTGYVENYQFLSGSDAVKIAFASDSAGQVTGTVILGNGTPPSPATDPDVGYPPGFKTQQPVVVGAPNYLAEGYAYPMHSATLVGQRLRFGVGLQDLWGGWCALQTPAPGSGSCLPNWGGLSSPTGCSLTNPDTGAVVPVDCGKFNLCRLTMVCQCDASECQVRDVGVSMMFDISIDNDRADGSMDTRNVHFTRDP